MSLLSGFNVTLPEVSLLGDAAIAAFAGRAVPAGWNVITPQQLGVPHQYWDGNYFTNNGASAIVLQQGNAWIVSFRGTDGSNDILSYPDLVLGTYINQFQPLLNAVASNAPHGTNFYFTGASLGGGATNEMANIAGSQYGGEFASATFVAFASPNISTANGILNFGFENDTIYKAISGYNDFSSSLDHLVVATSQYMQGNYNGLLPPDSYAHNASLGSAALAQLQSSVFFGLMNPDSVVVFDAFSGVVQDKTPGGENTGVFYLGSNSADTIVGRNGDDHIEGFGGNDVITGGGGNDVIDGGAGDNTAVYSGPSAQYSITASGSTFTVADTIPGRDGTDTLINIEHLQFTDRTIDLTPPTSVQQEVLGLYAALYNRAAEFPGYSFWVGIDGQQPDANGVTLANASTSPVTVNDAGVLGQAFVNTQSTYFNATYGSLTDNAFVNALYVNIAGNAGDPGGIAYWANLLAQAEAGGQSVQAARAGLAGQFVHDLIGVTLALFTTLTSDQLLAAEQRQEGINNKIAVSLAYSNASQGPGGAILVPHTIGDAAFQAATTILQGITYDPASVTAAIVGINNVIAHQDLTLI